MSSTAAGQRESPSQSPPEGAPGALAVQQRKRLGCRCCSLPAQSQAALQPGALQHLSEAAGCLPCTGFTDHCSGISYLAGKTLGSCESRPRRGQLQPGALAAAGQRKAAAGHQRLIPHGKALPPALPRPLTRGPGAPCQQGAEASSSQERLRQQPCAREPSLAARCTEHGFQKLSSPGRHDVCTAVVRRPGCWPGVLPDQDSRPAQRQSCLHAQMQHLHPTLAVHSPEPFAPESSTLQQLQACCDTGWHCT